MIFSVLFFGIFCFVFLRKMNKFEKMLETNNYLMLDKEKNLLLHQPKLSNRRTKSLSIDSILLELFDELEEEGISVFEFEAEAEKYSKMNNKYLDRYLNKEIDFEAWQEHENNRNKRVLLSYGNKSNLLKKVQQNNLKGFIKNQNLYHYNDLKNLFIICNNDEELIASKESTKDILKINLSKTLTNKMEI